MVNIKTTYVTEDGREFDTLEAAEEHEDAQKDKAEELYERYIRTSWGGKDLLSKHSLSTYGIWKVYGEDPNPDFGGPHHQPFLGKFEGTLEKVIRYAVALPNFWAWGSGGRIECADNEKIIKL